MAFLNEQGVGRLWSHIVTKLGSKVDKVEGKGLSTNDYTDEDKSIVDGVTSAIAEKSDADHTHAWSTISDKPFTAVTSDTLTWDGDTVGLLCPNGILYKVSDLVITLDDLSNGCSIEYAMNDSTVDAIEPIILTSDECQDRYSLDDNWIHLESVICVLADNSDSLLPETGIYFLNDEISRVKSFTIPGYGGFTTEKLDIEALPEHSHGEYISDEEFLAWLAEESMISPVATASGELYVNNNNEVYVL